MKVACIRQYDSYGDWMNSNGFIRYLLKEGIYDKLLHAYGRKEPHRRCDGPDSNNPTFNNLRCPSLENWEFIYE